MKKEIRLTQTADDMCIAFKRKKAKRIRDSIWCLLFFLRVSFFSGNIPWSTDCHSSFLVVVYS